MSPDTGRRASQVKDSRPHVADAEPSLRIDAAVATRRQQRDMCGSYSRCTCRLGALFCAARDNDDVSGRQREQWLGADDRTVEG
jgi:hypothetical protein